MFQGSLQAREIRVDRNMALFQSNQHSRQIQQRFLPPACACARALARSGQGHGHRQGARERGSEALSCLRIECCQTIGMDSPGR
jgi:hypothetical protein